jgi:phosphatidylserine/phosphatidylglycerophosphate/cardiolipin synthase-like enzyme
MNPPVPVRDAVRALLRRDDTANRDTLAQALAAEVATRREDALSDRIAAQIRDALADANRVSLIVTGLGWLGGGVQAIENALLRLVDSAEHELSLAVYAMSPGPERLWAAIERAVDGGIRSTIIVDRLDEQNPAMRDWIHQLRSRHAETLRLVDFRGEDSNDHLHAKIVVADRRTAIVGSANLTAHGLLLAHELALLVEGPAAEEIAEQLDLLARSHLVRAA